MSAPYELFQYPHRTGVYYELWLLIFENGICKTGFMNEFILANTILKSQIELFQIVESFPLKTKTNWSKYALLLCLESIFRIFDPKLISNPEFPDERSKYWMSHTHFE